VLINGVQMRNTLLQMSDHKQYWSLLLSLILIRIKGVITKRFSGGFGTLCGIDVIAVFGFGGDLCYVKEK
jgi:hypothetical protein